MAENTFVLKLEDGADVIAGLEKLARENNIDYGLLISACGKIKEFELLSNTSKKSVDSLKVEAAFDVQAISGKIENNKKNGLQTHVRVSIVNTGFTAKSGQLIRAKAAGNLEIGVRKVDMGKIIYS